MFEALLLGKKASQQPTLDSGQHLFTNNNSNFTIPAGVYSICAVAVGGGSARSGNPGGSGGDLRWKNDIPVVPGDIVNVTLQPSTFGVTVTPVDTVIKVNGVTVLVAAGGDVSHRNTSTPIGGKVGGGNGGIANTIEGGGAGGYMGDGGYGGVAATPGGGGGGAGGYWINGGTTLAGGGGGVGLLGLGATGAKGVQGGTSTTAGGGGGSGGANGSGTLNGGNYGGGAGSTTPGGATTGAGGARIIWGEGRAFPSTQTGDVVMTTSLLMHFDGANGSTTFTDVRGHTFTKTGAAIISTAQSRFGGASYTPNGGPSSQISTPDAADLRLDGDFTIEFWARLVEASQNCFLLGKNNSVLQHYNGLLYVRGDQNVYMMSPSYGGLYNTWRHIALTRQGNNWRLFLDGTLAELVSRSGDTWGVNSSPLCIGNNTSLADIAVQGFIDELRITKGLALYTANFTPPTGPLSV